MLATDCGSSIQGSTTSSSSDVMTLTTASSSWCAIAVPSTSRIRVMRLIRPHARRILVAPDANPSYGFAVRGGKEFGTGFFVSSVERSSEAELKGMRVGDQILRINGFRVDDAVHREFIQFVSTQDRVTLKVRGVGMLPTKDTESDRLSWHVVKTSSVSNTPSESSFRSAALERDPRSKDISVVLNVAPRTKLGLGICKGPEWKPGIFVQFTKDKSVAREAGLRPGDQILSVNSIDFSDVLFSEAVAVMKSASKLEMVVRTAAGCELFPGESSGYNSSASSVTGDQSPCWADAKSKRLTAVREEPMAACWNEPLCTEHRRCAPKQTSNAAENTLASGSCKGIVATVDKEANKTIIKLSENGTSINNTYIANSSPRLLAAPHEVAPNATAAKAATTGTSNAVPPPPPPPSNRTTAQTTLQGPSALMELYMARQSETKTVSVDVHRSVPKRQQAATLQHDNHNHQEGNYYAQKSATLTSTALGLPPKAHTFKTCRSNNAISINNRNHHCGDSYNADNNNAGSTLSSAISRELKKRKEVSSRYELDVAQHHNQHHHHHIELAQLTINAAPPASKTDADHKHSQQLASSLPMLKRAQPTNGSGRPAIAGSGRCSSSDQHSALMDEFKRAHQRMFKNGFHESERKERQDALKRTTIMEDDVNHRTSRNFTAETKNSNDRPANGNDVSPNGQPVHIPPPPPQFANSPPSVSATANAYKTSQQPKSCAPPASSRANQSIRPPPSSPTPDYDNVQIRSAATAPSASYGYASTNSKITNSRESAGATNTVNRRTMRLGTVTIGEYDANQRKEPTKFDFISNAKRNNDDSTSLQSELQNTLTRANLKKKASSNGHMEHQSDCPMQNGYDSKGGGGMEHGDSFNNGSRSNKNVELASTSASARSNGGGSNGGGTGILKNGNGSSRNSGSNFAKGSEKTITFGN